MKVRKKGYWILFVVTIICTLAAVATLIPYDGASKVGLLGYKSFCSFAPFSTFVCVIFAGMSCFIRKGYFVSYK